VKIEKVPLRKKIAGGFHWLRKGPRTPGYPFTANWQLLSNFLYVVQTTFNQWFRPKIK
jgi:hypothetical protein